GKLRQLAFYFERYGSQLEADFQSCYQLDLGELWRSGKHDRILRLIGQLPQDSRFAASVAQDPEHVEAILEATGGQQSEYAPPLVGWSTANDQLATVIDELQVLIATLVAANGGSPGKVKPAPRPKTGFQDARAKMAKSKHKALVARVMRKRAPVD